MKSKRSSGRPLLSSKSTLPSFHELLEEATRKGYLEGVNITDKPLAMREKMGNGFPTFNLFPNMTVMEALHFSPVRTKEKIKEWLKRERMSWRRLFVDKADAYPQRICLEVSNNVC